MKKTDYGNWVPVSMFYVLVPACIIFAGLTVLFWIGFTNKFLMSFFLVFFACTAAMTVYMWTARNTFSFTKGGLMGVIHQYLLDHLEWNGEGKCLDIGCGAGALTIRCAKQYPHAVFTGMDYWGKEWSYAKEQCEENAVIEGVKDRITFEKGDAASLPYPSESFDAAISNFVFHEVRTQPDKRKVVMEALRVVKKGGSFAFQDMFGQKSLYGDMDEFIQILKDAGIQEIHYIPDVDRKDFIPKYLRAPWMLYEMGLLYGVK